MVYTVFKYFFGQHVMTKDIYRQRFEGIFMKFPKYAQF